MADAFRLSCSSSLFASSNASQRCVLPSYGLIRRASPNSDNCACAAPGFAVAPSSLATRRNLASFKVHAAVAETNQPKWWERNVGPNMIDIHSTQEFLSALSEAGDRLVVVEFYGTWCASCRALFPKLCKIAQQHPEILFLKVNFDENKPMCKSLRVKVLPCFHFYRGADGQIEAFSCSLAKFKKIKDAIATHNVAPYSSNGSASNHRVLTLESLVKDQS